MTPDDGTANGNNPLKVAIVGAGPAGFYAALDLLGRDDLDVRVDMFDRLPAPYGLVRYGVAPDHAKIKSVTRVYERGIEAAGDRYRFFGNVELSSDVSLDELLQRYHAVILSYGAQDDRHLGIPGEDLPGVYAAREFVAWYNSHPDFADAEFDLDAECAMVVGIGNVAIDVARILASTDEELSVTDINPKSQEQIVASPITKLLVVARRGPAQAACTAVELREMSHMQDSALVVSEQDLELDPLSRRLLEEGGIDKQHQRNLEVMAQESMREAPDGRFIQLRFYESPVEFIGTDHVEAVRIRRNTLTQRDDGKVVVSPTEETFTIPCQVVFRSIGYKIAPIAGVPFYSPWSIIPNDRGQVLTDLDGDPVPGLFVAGWAKRGPSGVIGTNKPDAVETVEVLLEAHARGELTLPQPEDVATLLEQRDVRFVTYEDWKRIDALEVQAGQAVGRPRLKFDRVEDMLAVLESDAP